MFFKKGKKRDNLQKIKIKSHVSDRHMAKYHRYLLPVIILFV